LSATATYGSGLTNGVSPADCNCSYGTGLFDFNKGIKVDPSTVFNASAGYSIVAGGTVLQPEIYVDNIFNKIYLLKARSSAVRQLVGRVASGRLKVAF